VKLLGVSHVPERLCGSVYTWGAITSVRPLPLPLPLPLYELLSEIVSVTLRMRNAYVYNREFERNASGLLTELYEIDQEKSHKLLTQKLKTWNNSSVLELANDAQLMDFMQHDCCQTKINKMWHGRFTIDTKIWKVRLTESRYVRAHPPFVHICFPGHLYCVVRNIAVHIHLLIFDILLHCRLWWTVCGQWVWRGAGERSRYCPFTQNKIPPVLLLHTFDCSFFMALSCFTCTPMRQISLTVNAICK